MSGAGSYKHVNCVLMHRMPSRESARNPRENIDAFNLDSRSVLSSFKLMEENRHLCTHIQLSRSNGGPL